VKEEPRANLEFHGKALVSLKKPAPLANVLSGDDAAEPTSGVVARGLRGERHDGPGDAAGSHFSHARKLRARRLRVKELNLGDITAHVHSGVLGSITATVEDLSLYGMALVIPSAAAKVVLAGDKLEHVRVQIGDQVAYDGSVVVRRVSENGDDLVLGVELEPGLLDLGEIYRRAERHTFAERLHAIDRDLLSNDIPAALKAWVADARTYLETAKQFLDAEERALAVLDLHTRQERLAQYLDESAPLVRARVETASQELAVLVASLPAEQHPPCRAFVRKHLLPLLMESPLLRRTYEKPLGYAGDYEMMNMLYRDHAEGGSLFAKALNVYGANTSAAQANINRVTYLGDLIRTLVADSGDRRVRVASVGCGPAREIYALLESSPELGRRLDVSLIDQEDRAITYCERTLGPLAAQTDARLHLIRESVRRLLATKQLSTTLGRCDLIYSAGLFDYLSGRSFQALLGALYDALVPGGLLAVGNVACHNPTRWFMEYCLDWFLIHRSREELLAFGKQLTPAPASLRVDCEPLGVNLFLLARS
jgi:extracellular factor (EF) 3-hydroxypalmitic acid methyl ester biosynthesis protein